MGWSNPLFLTDLFTDGEALYQWVENNGWEGIVSKRLSSTYKKGKEHRDWYKKKTALKMKVEIVGLLIKNGQISSLVMRQDGLYRGRNSSGLNGRVKAQLIRLPAEKSSSCYFPSLPAGLKGEKVIWLNAPFTAEVSATEITEAGTLRHPRILSLSIVGDGLSY